MNLMLLLEMARDGYPDRVAIGSREGDALTFDQLYQRAGAASAQLRDRGARHLAYIGTNSPAFAVAAFAAAWAGVPLLPVNYRLGPAQIQALLDKHADLTVVVDPDLGIRPVARDVTNRDEWLAEAAIGSAEQPWPDDADAIAVLLYTSGTTSEPKAAILRHRHLLSYVLGSVDFGSADASEAALITVPPYHVAGVANLLTNLHAGRRVVYSAALTARAWLDTARRELVTNAMVVPTMLARIVAELEGETDACVPSLRVLAYGGSKVPPTVIAEALRLFPGTGFVNAYGLTETSSTIAVLGPDDHRTAAGSKDPAAAARLASAGRLIPGVEAEIRAEDGTALPPGVPGELWLRGQQISGEYLGRQAPLDARGWFPTRDRAYFDADGFLFVEGRADDTIIRGGENTSPTEIEEILMRHPCVADAAVVGVADDEWGQRIAAVVVPARGRQVDPQELREFTRRYLRSSKTPDRIEIWTRLPYTDTGKLLRRTVLERLESGAAC